MAIMIPFLKQVALYYLSSVQIEKSVFIFPNRRSAVFFKKYLCEAVKEENLSIAAKEGLVAPGLPRPLIMPGLCTVNEFFHDVAGTTEADRVDLLLNIYESYCEVFHEHAGRWGKNKAGETGSYPYGKHFNEDNALYYKESYSQDDEDDTTGMRVPDSLDDFIHWGEILLSDFDDVDKYLVPAERIFTNIADFRNIGTGLDDLEPAQKEAVRKLVRHFTDTDLSDNSLFKDRTKRNFVYIWDMLADIYKNFRERLCNSGLSYEGMTYRHLAERVKATPVVDVLRPVYGEGRKFIFVGLNALNECEKAVMRKMRDAGIAEFCWDCSGKMLKDRTNRASAFMYDPKNQGRGNMEQFPPPPDFNLDPEGLPMPEINVVAVPSSTGQTSLLPMILNEVSENGTAVKEPGLPVGTSSADMEAGVHDKAAAGGTAGPAVEDCAVVIPDESLLLPLLNSIPPEETAINVTMGFPMSGSSFFALMTQVCNLQMHLRRQSDGTWSFYHKQVHSIFANEIFRALLSAAEQEIMDRIKQEAKFYILENDFKAAVPPALAAPSVAVSTSASNCTEPAVPGPGMATTPLLDTIFSPVVTDLKATDSGQIAAFGSYLLSVIEALAKGMAQKTDLALELDFAKRYWQSLNLLGAKTLNIQPATYIRLLSRMIGGTTVPFNGEPLQGLQIMGPLETRALDFKNLIIFSANEGVFPRKSSGSSFIPPELRAGFGLPSYEHHDGIWAYYFYRMIQRASKVWLIYDSRTEGMKAGEESRYIKQLEYIYHDLYNIPVKRFIAGAGSGTCFQTATGGEMAKDASVMEILRRKKFSASAIQEYIACPMKYYYGEIAGLHPEGEVSESLDAATIGSILHEVMQAIFTGGEAMDPGFFFENLKAERHRRLNGEVPQMTDEAYARCSDVLSGEARAIVSKSYLQQWLKRDGELEAKVNALIGYYMKSSQVSGRDLVSRNLIMKYVHNILTRDIEFLDRQGTDAVFEVLGLELYKEKRLFAEEGSEGYIFCGYIDRLDRTGDMVRVVDYKTGKVTENDVNIPEDESEAGNIANKVFGPGVKYNERPKIALQLYIYDRFMEGDPRLGAGRLYNSVYSMTSLATDEVKNLCVTEAFSRAIGEGLKAKLEELFDPSRPFIRTTDEKTCEYCDFKQLCSR